MAAEIASLRALLVHDLNAARFCRANGFLASPIDPLMLMVPFAMAQKGLGEGTFFATTKCCVQTGNALVSGWEDESLLHDTMYLRLPFLLR